MELSPPPRAPSPPPYRVLLDGGVDGVRWHVTSHVSGDSLLVRFVKFGQHGKLLDQTAHWTGDGWAPHRWNPTGSRHVPDWIEQKIIRELRR